MTLASTMNMERAKRRWFRCHNIIPDLDTKSIPSLKVYFRKTKFEASLPPRLTAFERATIGGCEIPRNTRQPPARLPSIPAYVEIPPIEPNL